MDLTSCDYCPAYFDDLEVGRIFVCIWVVDAKNGICFVLLALTHYVC